MPFPRYVRRHHPSGAEPHPGDLALPGVRLLGLRGPDFETHALEVRVLGAGERWRDGLERAARLADAAEHLLERRCTVGGACEGALWREEGPLHGRGTRERGGLAQTPLRWSEKPGEVFERHGGWMRDGDGEVRGALENPRSWGLMPRD